jgi:hypothetical protein
VRFNNRSCALLGIPDLPFGAFEHVGNGKIKPQGGGGSWDPTEIAEDTVSSIVDTVVDPVGTITDTLDKADNWTEAVGEDLAKIDPGPAIGDAGEFIDNAVIQPMAKDPVGSIATIAVIASQQYYLLPVVAAANTAIKGGSLEDIALAAGIAYAGAQFAPGINEWAGGGLTGSITTGAALGAGGAGTTAAIKGKDVGEAILRGGVAGGVMGGVGYGVSQGFSAAKTELGLGNTYSPDFKADTEFLAAQAESARAAGAGEAQIEQILKFEGVPSFTAADVASMTASGFGEKAVAQNLAASYTPSELYTPPTTPISGLEKAAQKVATKAIAGSILDEIFPTPEAPEAPARPLVTRRRSTSTGNYIDDEAVGSMDSDNAVNLTAVAPSKYELRKYANDSGNTTMISFKDDEPQAPIPAGYSEVERIGAAKGGLIDSTKSETMVKYSKKPLLAKRKPEVATKKKTTRKGLAAKQS